MRSRRATLFRLRMGVWSMFLSISAPVSGTFAASAWCAGASSLRQRASRSVQRASGNANTPGLSVNAPSAMPCHEPQTRKGDGILPAGGGDRSHHKAGCRVDWRRHLPQRREARWQRPLEYGLQGMDRASREGEVHPADRPAGNPFGDVARDRGVAVQDQSGNRTHRLPMVGDMATAAVHCLSRCHAPGATGIFSIASRIVLRSRWV